MEEAAGDMKWESEEKQELFIQILQAVEADRPDAVREGIHTLNKSLDRVEQRPGVEIYKEDLLTRKSLVGYLLHESFSLAATLGRERCLEAFLEEGVPVDQVAVQERDTALMTACRHGHVDSARLLTRHGANVNALSTKHETAMFLAANPEIMQVLYDNGADVNVENPQSETPLMRSVKVTAGGTEDAGNYARLCWLLAHGTLLDHKDADGATAVIHACQRGARKCVRALVTAGACVYITDTTNKHVTGNGLLASAIYSNSLDMVKLVLELVPESLLRQWKSDSRVLDAPIRERNDHRMGTALSMIEYFLQQGWSLTGNLEKVVYPRHEDLYFRRHPLHHAASMSNPQVIEFFTDVYTTRGLSVDCGCQFTPLHQACASKTPHSVERLLAAGADPTVRDHRKALPLVNAVDSADLELHGHMSGLRVFPFGATLRCVTALLRHADPYYLHISDVTLMLLLCENVLKPNAGSVSPKNARLLCAAMLIFITALYEASPAKYYLRGLLAQMRVVRVGDPPGVTAECALSDSPRWEYLMAPASLRLSARDAVRSALRDGLPAKIARLPLPSRLRAYLNIPELDTLLAEYCSMEFEKRRL